MNDALDRDWFGVEKMEPDVWEDLDGLFLQKKGHKTPRWQRYVDSRRLEITCGEAPYLAERYDVSTGEEIEVSSRRGLLDRKLLAISHLRRRERIGSTGHSARWKQRMAMSFRETIS